jgi:MinD-like ATPase involved in chromosome partitioning or flagellar assembly
MPGERAGVLIAAAGAPWEVQAIRVLAGAPAHAALVKRCVDLADLLATASTGQARVAVVGDGLPGLDADSVSHLRRHGVAVLVVTQSGSGASAPVLPGVSEVLTVAELPGLAALVRGAAAGGAEEGRAAGSAGGTPDPAAEEPDSGGSSGALGRIVAVWGPTGAPGRTTVAVNLAAELGRRGRDTLLVDADCYGGAVGQHLGVLDEVSGLLGAVRLANTGRLDAARLASTARSAGPGLRVLTGLPRPDRWPEVRAAAFDSLVETARRLCPYVVLDLGFNLEQEPQGYAGAGPQRNQMTVAGLDHADQVVVVGAADPVGLARMARGLVELPEVVPAPTTRVVVNRVRPSLGWGEQEVRAMVEGFVLPASMHFLPEDTAAVDRALVAGRPLSEVGDSSLGRALDRLVDAVDGDRPVAARRRATRLRRRRAGRGR